MNAETLVDRATDTGDQTNLCVVLSGVGEAGLKVLLVADEKGRWSIPGGHAKDTESQAEAAVREVKEETGLEVEVQPLMWADHAARQIASNVFYAVADGEPALQPGGGDVTKAIWVSLNELGSLNGTDRLVIQVAANRVHNPQGMVDDAVEMAETLGFAVGNVAAPPPVAAGIYFKLNGKAAFSYAQRLAEWSTATIVNTNGLFESTKTALERASKGRRLTPMLDSLLHVSDALWRYESIVAPRLAEGHIVLEIGPAFDRQPLLNRGMPADLLENVVRRIPQPNITFDVGDEFNLVEFQIIKDAIEQAQNPDDPKYHIDRLKPRDVQVPWKMELVRTNPNDPENPIVRCPKCKHEGPLMDDFSYLAADYNGIKPGDDDDLEAQECGVCGAKMEWRHIDDMIGLNP